VAIIYRKELSLRKQQSGSFLSFEHLEATLSTGNDSLRLICIYRPPASSRHSVSTGQFLTDFSKYIDSKALSSGKLVTVGDFNFHMDNKTDRDTIKFIDTLDSLNLSQHVIEPTHEKGHILDIVLTRSDDCPFHNLTVSPPSLSDHSPITITVPIHKPSAQKVQVTCRKINHIDQQAFESDLAQCELITNPPDNITDLMNMYNTTLIQILDNHAPLKTKTITRRQHAEWFTEDVRNAKVDCRNAENRWRKNKLTVYLDDFKTKCKAYAKLCRKAKTIYYLKEISDSAGDQKKLFQITQKLLKKDAKCTMPSDLSPTVIADKFADFFVEKIEKIRSTFSVKSSTSDKSDNLNPVPNLSTFTAVTKNDLQQLIMSSKSKSCQLDPIPTMLLKSSLKILLPVIHKIINLSLSSATVPPSLKLAVVTPLLKKQSLNADDLKNYRPISNLPYIAKLTEKIVVQQLTDHTNQHSLHEPLQSAYKSLHSTETALLKVYNDILEAIDNKRYVFLILLDLSAAFDTIDHQILLERLSLSFGINGTALNWFKSYMHDRTQHISVHGNTSTPRTLKYGIPQGSVLGPLAFTCYSAPIGKICREHNIDYHLYADDTQLYLSFSLSDQNSATQKIEICVKAIKLWMNDNFLKLNDSKTELLLLSSPYQAKFMKLPPTITIGSHQIDTSKTARNIGAIFDQHMHMIAHVNSICRSCYVHVRNIGKIRPYLTRDATEKLIHAFITSRLDNLNSLLIGLPDYLLQRLQKIQNNAARIVTRSRKYDRMTPTLITLHWLPIKYRIKYKILLLTFKCLHNLAPRYLSDLLTHYHPVRTLRSGEQNLLLEQTSHTVRYGERTFKYCAPKLWNALPQHMREYIVLDHFKTNLKTFLFKEAFSL